MLMMIYGKVYDEGLSYYVLDFSRLQEIIKDVDIIKLLHQYNGCVVSQIIVSKPIKIPLDLKAYFKLKNKNIKLRTYRLDNCRSYWSIYINNLNISKSLVCGEITLAEYKMIQEYIYDNYKDNYVFTNSFSDGMYFDNIDNYNKFKEYFENNYAMRLDTSIF